MEEIRQLLFRILSAAFVCASLGILMPEGSGKRAARLLGGMLMALTLLSSLTHLDAGAMVAGFLPQEPLHPDAVAQGEELSRTYQRQLIKQETEAYILHKAGELQADLQVEVTLSEEDYPVPVGVILRGQVDPEVRRQLSQQIERELSIPKEEQQWIG